MDFIKEQKNFFNYSKEQQEVILKLMAKITTAIDKVRKSKESKRYKKLFSKEFIIIDSPNPVDFNGLYTSENNIEAIIQSDTDDIKYLPLKQPDKLKEQIL